MLCRHCKTPLIHTFVDLGFAPPSNAYLKKEDLVKPELYYPLNVKVCNECWLVQTEDYTEAESLFNSTYAYFSSTSIGWLKHAQDFCNLVQQRFKLNEDSFVIEVASNDGYLLKNFKELGIPCLGIEPTESTAKAAEEIGIRVIKEFFGMELGSQLASKKMKADLVIGNNVYAHVPDINNFTEGLKEVLKDEGVVTLEFPHLMKLIKHNQFDTIYHEHFSYLSLYTVQKIFHEAGLRIFDVEKISTHGGSLRIYGCHDNSSRPTLKSVEEILMQEEAEELRNLSTYQNFQEKVAIVKSNLLEFLLKTKKENKKVVAYGAAAKGNTLLNFSGVTKDFLPVVFDAAVSKQNMFLPGSHIPIKPSKDIIKFKPDFVIILPWNIKEEITGQLKPILSKSVKFVTFIPDQRIL